jgi:hypothetical protein
MSLSATVLLMLQAIATKRGHVHDETATELCASKLVDAGLHT